MKIPEILHINFKDEAGGHIKNLFCIVTFYFGQHNCLSIRKITSTSGQIIISREDIQIELNESQILFLMDYRYDLDDFDGNVEVIIEDKSLLQNRIKRIGEYYSESTLGIANILQKTNNDLFIPVREKVVVDFSPFKTEIILLRKSIAE